METLSGFLSLSAHHLSSDLPCEHRILTDFHLQALMECVWGFGNMLGSGTGGALIDVGDMTFFIQ